MKISYPDFVDSHFGNILSQIEDSGRVVCITLLASLFTIAPVGYHMVAFNVPEKIIQNHVNESFTNVFNSPLSPSGMSIFWSVTIASQGLGALIGCAFVVPLSSWLGAKRVLTGVNNYLLLASSICFIISYMLNLAPFLILGRLFSGAYTGIGCAMLPLFVQEVAPKQIKGSILCFMHIAVCLGSSASAVISLPFMLGGPRTWWIHLSLPALFGIAQLLTGSLIPDTPNHLIQNGKYTAALQAIDFYYDINPDNEDQAIREYWERVPQMATQLSLWSAMRNPRVRWGCIIGMIVSAAQVFSGSMVTISYSTSMFNSVSFMDALVPFLPALGSLVSVLLTLPALQLVETTGRRQLLLKTLVICVIADCLFLIFTLLSVNPDDWWASWLFGASFLVYGVGYNLGVGPLAYFIPSELVPPEAASVALGSAVAVNWLCTMFTTLIYYPLQHLVGGWSYMLFILPSSIFLLFLWRFLPETRFHYYEHDELGVSRSLTELDPILPYGTFERELVNGFDDNEDEQSLL
ncbi:hypothetical protein PFISCL1PPCAC_13634 [Pristionchus fissidentatus]|uniref:Major facilitator superfamily (MFS) profile domain-containing protein n=1 Tax=Pristionchus fissidentatus TaxID=1538716 RepID=A0AAV5VUF0_9BILA|nr:hypothetical protein PFISCL1PPCAC_13634 [Pristionchus fissidentatus]